MYDICPGCIIEDGFDYSYFDIPNGMKTTETQQECADFALSTPGGHYWTWNKDSKTCYVKSSKA